jgi:hypothetical protein
MYLFGRTVASVRKDVVTSIYTLRCELARMHFGF